MLALPEVNIVIFAFLFNFVWEFWQVPFFEGLSSAQHWPMTKFCSLASVGDAVVALASVALVRSRARRHALVLHPSVTQVSLFTMAGIVIILIGGEPSRKCWARGHMLSECRRCRCSNGCSCPRG